MVREGGATRVSAGRRVGLEVLERTASGAFASDALRELSAGLAARDAGLAGQIVFGCLRFQAQLDYLIGHYAGRDPKRLDEIVRIVLRAAIFQLRYLERVPAHAAVHEAVEYVKGRQRAAAGLINAVLRKVTRAPLAWPDRATELSTPEWLIVRWERHFGHERALAIAKASLEEPVAYARVAGADGAEVRLQDIGSQSIVPLLELQTGETFLDICAAPGNKTLQALETELGFAVACDVSWRRLKEVPAIVPRVVVDAMEPLPFDRLFQKILVDAPCSGTGTLARNPEIKWRLREEELRRFGERQLAILGQAFRQLAPGGRLVYATCSLEEEENEKVVREALARDAAMIKRREVWRLPGREEGDGFYSAVLERAPH